MRRTNNPLPWLAGLLVVYLLLPIAAFFLRLPGAGVELHQPGVFSALGTSIATATISSVVIAVLGIPLAYLLARGRGRLSQLITVAVQLPLAMPPLVSGILLIYVVGPYTPLGRLFGGHLTGSLTGIILAQTFVAAPFLIIAARSAFAAVDPALPRVAATLGHGALSRFFKVYLPIALPGIQAGLLLSWLRAFGEFGATVILAYHPYSLPVYTFVQFSSAGLPGTLAPVALTLLAAFAVLALANFHWVWRRRGLVELPSPTPPRPQHAPMLAFDLKARLVGFALDVQHRAKNRHLALLGPSGAGKSLTLQLLAGLRRPDQGAIQCGRETLTRLSPEQRSVGYVPQQSSLLPGLNVWQQVNFGVNADPGTAAYWLGQLHLDGLENRYPDQLSGGQQRRVALARALANGPRILLLDEPFSALDTPVRDELRRELRRLQHEVGLTTILVTHDPEEAALLAEEVMVLDQGRVIQAGERTSVFSRPASAQVARLLGIRNMGHGRVAGPDCIQTAGIALEVSDHGLAPGTPVSWCVRAEHVRLDPEGPYAGVIVDIADLGASRELVVVVGDGLELTLRTPAAGDLAAGSRCRFDLSPRAISVWAARRDEPAATGQVDTARSTSLHRAHPARSLSGAMSEVIEESPGRRSTMG